MQQDPHPLRRAISSFALSLALFVVVPWVLITATRSRFDGVNPLVDIPVPWRWNVGDLFRDVVSEPLRDDAIVNLLIRTCLCIVWLALVAMAATVVVEVVHMIRHRGMASPRLRGLGWAQPVARWIAVGVIALLPLHSSGATSAREQPLRPMTTAARVVEPPTLTLLSAAAVPVDVVPSAPTGTHTVRRGESIYGIAGDYAGSDAARADDIADAILDLNLGEVMNDGQRFVNPALIQPGWDLALPPGIGEPNASVPAPSSNGNGNGPYVVVTGDTLSGIAQDRLGDADEWPQIWEQNAGDDMGAGRTFDDPDLILPGWEIEVPAHAAIDTAAPGALPNPPTNTPPSPTSTPHTTTATPDPSSGASPPTHPSTSVPSTTVPSTSVPAAVPGADDAGRSGRDDAAPRAPSPIHLEHAALVAAGVLALIGVRRRRSLRASLPHARVPTPAPEVAATERRLRTIDPGERAARVDIAVRALAHRIAGSGVQVGTIRIAPDGELIARLTGDAHLDAPWACGQGAGLARSWTLPASVPIELLGDDARHAGQPCVALVTVGIDADGRDVLLDLEAAGATCIEATPRQGDEVVRAIGAALAASLPCEVAHFLVAGLDVGALLDHPNVQRLACGADAVHAAATAVGATLANERSAFDLRTRRTGGEMWEPAIILLAHADDATKALAGLPATGHGVAAVAVVDPHGFDDAPGAVDVGARLRAHADRWELVAFDETIEVAPIGLSDDDVAEIAAVLDEAARPIDIDAGAPVLVDSGAQVAEPLAVVPHDIVVTVMGDVSVVDREGNAGTFQRSKTVELIAWLATHRGRATRSAARTALWELDVRDATFANVVSEARRALGRLVPPEEGDEWLARTLTDSLPLHERVVTDADLILQRVEHARVAPPAHAVDVLRPAVEMIRGLPFAGSSYLWPDADGLTSNLVLLATTATAELAAHALSVGDIELVFWATGRGLAVLPGHEELVGLRMRAHARTGDLAGVRQEWESYERVITADAWSDGEPAPKLLDLRRRLLTPLG